MSYLKSKSRGMSISKTMIDERRQIGQPRFTREQVV